MSANHAEPVDFDGWLFSVNRNKIPRDQIEKHAGKQVAYSLDGTRILASGTDEDEVDRQLTAAGIDPGKVVYGYIDPLDGPSLL